MIDKIRNEKQYNEVMSLIETHITKATTSGGFHTLSKKENAELKQLSAMAEKYEDEALKIMPLPVTVPAIVSQKMQEMNVTQNKLAELLGLGVAKLSLILNGKRKPDIPFLKAIHEKLGIDGNLILERV